MLARDLMRRRVITVHQDLPMEDLCDVFQENHLNCAPVVDDDGRLVGMVSKEDILFGSMGRLPQSTPRPAESTRRAPCQGVVVARVRDIMTSPAVFAMEGTRIKDLCRMMWQLRIHRIPIVRHGKVVGIVSSMDYCRAVSQGEIQLRGGPCPRPASTTSARRPVAPRTP